MTFISQIKLAVTLSITFILTATSYAQEIKKTKSGNYEKGFRLGFGINAGVPTNNTYDFALGGDVRLQYDLSEATSVTLTTGFTNLFIGNGAKDLGFIPLKAGLKAFVLNNQFYVLGEAGVAFAVTNGYNETSILLSPGIGYANKYIDLSLRYEDYNK